MNTTAVPNRRGDHGPRTSPGLINPPSKRPYPDGGGAPPRPPSRKRQRLRRQEAKTGGQGQARIDRALRLVNQQGASAFGTSTQHNETSAPSPQSRFPPVKLLNVLQERAHKLDDTSLLQELAVHVLESGPVAELWTRRLLTHRERHPPPMHRCSWVWLTRPLRFLLDPAPDIAWNVHLTNDTLGLWSVFSLPDSMKDLWTIPHTVLGTDGLALILELEQRGDRLFSQIGEHRLHYAKCRLDDEIGSVPCDTGAGKRLAQARQTAAMHVLRALWRHLTEAGVPPLALQCDLQRALVDLMTTFLRPQVSMDRAICTWAWRVIDPLTRGIPPPTCTKESRCRACRPPVGQAARSDYARMLTSVTEELAQDNNKTRLLLLSENTRIWDKFDPNASLLHTCQLTSG